MGGAVPTVKKVLDLPRKDGGQGTVAQQIKEAGAEPAMTAKSATAEKKEEVASTLRARRRGARALLSEARLNPELGVQTLGSGPSL